MRRDDAARGGYVDERGRYVRPEPSVRSAHGGYDQDRRTRRTRPRRPEPAGSRAVRRARIRSGPRPWWRSSWHVPVGLLVLALSVLGVVAGTLVGRMPWETPGSATAQFRFAQTYQLEAEHTYDVYSKVLLLEDACTVSPQGGAGAVLRQDLDLDSAVVQDEALWMPVLTFRVSAAGEYRLSCEAGHPMLLADPQQIPDQHRHNTAVMAENDANAAVLLGAFLGLPLGAVLCGVGSARRRPHRADHLGCHLPRLAGPVSAGAPALRR